MSAMSAMPKPSLRTLLKIQLFGAFGIGKIINSRSPGGIAKFIAASVGIAFLALFVAGYAFAIGYGLVWLGAADIIPSLVVVACSLTSVISLFLKANGLLFNADNIDMTVSMPIPMWKIVVSRIAPMYGLSLAVSLVVGLPMLGIYLFSIDVGLLGILIGILLLLCLPAIPMAISLALAFLVAWAASRTPFADKLLSVIGLLASVALIVAIFFFQSIGSDSDFDLQTIESFVADFQARIASIWPPAIWATEALQGNLISLVLFFGASLATLGAMVLILSKVLLALNTLLASGAARRSKKIKDISVSESISKSASKNRSAFSALLMKEFKMWIGIPIYFMNTAVGPVLCLVVGILAAVVGSEALTNLIITSHEFSDFTSTNSFADLIPWVLGLFCSMTALTSCSTSLEGKTRWIMQAAPVSSSTVVAAKIVFHLLVIVPFAVISSLIAAISAAQTVMDVVLLLLIPVGFATYSACLGAFLDLRKPKYEWASAYEAVKRSANMAIVIFSGLLLVFAGIAASLVLGQDWELMGLLFGIALLAISALFARLALRCSLQDR